MTTAEDYVNIVDEKLATKVVEIPNSNAQENTCKSEGNICHGNVPSTILMCGKLDAFACGQLIALTEHRAVILSKILNFKNEEEYSDTDDRINRLAARGVKLDMALDSLMDLYQNHDSDEADIDNNTTTGCLKTNFGTSMVLKYYASYSNQWKSIQPCSSQRSIKMQCLMEFNRDRDFHVNFSNF